MRPTRDGTTPEVADDEPSIEQRMMRDERMGADQEARDGLAGTQRTAVLMHKYQGLDYRQIGDCAEAERVGDQVAAVSGRIRSGLSLK